MDDLEQNKVDLQFYQQIPYEGKYLDIELELKSNTEGNEVTLTHKGVSGLEERLSTSFKHIIGASDVSEVAENIN